MTDRHRRIPVTRLRAMTVGRLEPAEREAVIEESYAIFGTYFAGHDRETFARIALPTEETRVALLHAPDGAVAGFASSHIQRLTIDGRDHAAMGASAFVRSAYRAGTRAGLHTAGEAARFMLRHPGVRFGFLGAVLGPTTYQRFAQSFDRVYPNRREGFPPEIARIARAFAEARGLAADGAPPWVVDLGVQPLRTAPMTPARAADPDVQYFCAVNPRYVDGHALLVWIPLDATNLGSALLTLARDVATAALNRVRR